MLLLRKWQYRDWNNKPRFYLDINNRICRKATFIERNQKAIKGLCKLSFILMVIAFIITMGVVAYSFTI